MKNLIDNSYTNLILLRGLAAGLVLYDHLFCVGGKKWFGGAFFPATLIRNNITNPLGIIQDFGWFGVVLFFLISGFLITHVSYRETQREFLIRRILRIYPPLIIAILFTAGLTWLQGSPLFQLKDYLLSFTLINYVVYPQIVTLGVAWTLVIEVLFYIMIFFISPVFKKNPVVALSLEVIVVIFILQTARNWGNGYFLFAASASYLPYLIAGQLIYLFHKKYIGITTFSLFSFMTYGLMVAQLNIMYPQFLVRENSYLISFAYAYSLFCVAFLLRSYIKQFKIISFASNTSYSLYLYHGTVGFALLEYLSKFTQNRWVILPVVFICYLVAYLAYRLVEIPSIRLAKLLAEKINLRYST